ncbi:MAG: SusE domain-containing protein [Mediterranea sp.]|jgi:hypothetical protein|nr:SusE domain-containing protein [Mediterranea sp.]
MKKIIGIYALLLLALTGCQKDYKLNSSFSVPTQLNSPAPVQLDVTSTNLITLSWTGGGADDGGIVLYNVLFDKQGGDFSNPLATMKSDQGGLPQLSLTQAALNTLARNAGIHPDETGTLQWTVTAARGGVTRPCDQVATLTLTRGDGIDNIPTQLYLEGTAAETSGQAFRQVSDGVFQIYTRLTDGDITFKSATTGDAFDYYVDPEGKLTEGEGNTTVTTSGNNVARLTVDFNTMQMTRDVINPAVRCIWGATYANIAVLNYIGDGKFQGDGDIVFYGPGRPGTPDWCGWVEERYYFIANVNGTDLCWGRGDDVSAERPVGGEPASFYALYESPWTSKTQWDHLWKMKGTLDETHATITIDTNADGLMIHTFTNVTPL